jgi:hypothetical protein
VSSAAEAAATFEGWPTPSGFGCSIRSAQIDWTPPTSRETLLTVELANGSDQPAVLTRMDASAASTILACSDHYFWLASRERRAIEVTLRSRSPAAPDEMLVCFAGNAPETQIPVFTKP